ncbi:UDP-N-acetylmuramoyl-L-alanine--D-glutamate ligase, partial [Bacillus sp. D-CC]
AASTFSAKGFPSFTITFAPNFCNNVAAAELQAKGMDVVCGGHPLELLERNISLVVKNPGIPYSNPILVAAKEKQIPIVT